MLFKLQARASVRHTPARQPGMTDHVALLGRSSRTKGARQGTLRDAGKGKVVRVARGSSWQARRKLNCDLHTVTALSFVAR